MLKHLILITALLLTPLAGLEAAELYVADNGNDKATGEFPPACVERLQAIGKWMRVNGESIYGTQRGPFPYLAWGVATRKNDMLYLHVFDWPQDGKLRVPLSNKVQSAKLLAPGENLAVKNLDGKVVIEVPANAPDAAASVIALRIEGEPIIEPLPTAGAKATASASIPGNGPENAIDGTGEKRWRAPLEAKSAWLELELKQATTIGAFCLDEQILWPRVKQKFKLEAFVDGEWKILAEAKTSGHGIKQTITPVTAQKFRLTLECDKGSPGVAELLLCPTER